MTRYIIHVSTRSPAYRHYRFHSTTILLAPHYYSRGQACTSILVGAGGTGIGGIQTVPNVQWSFRVGLGGGETDGSGNSNSRGRLNDNRIGEGLLIYRQATI